LTVAELGGRQEDLSSFVDDPLAMPDAGSGDVEDIWLRLQRVSGFPEPYLTNKAASWRRWSDTYGRQVLREDIRDLVVLNNMQGVETLFALLPFRVGSPLSVNALAEDLKVSFNTVKSWLDVMERFFLMFRIPPWTASISRAIRKERKLYLFNVPLIEDPGARFENAVAMELFRAVTQWNESGRGPFALHYVRNKDKEEVDFLLAYKNRPFLLIECKMSDDRPSSALCRFQARLDVPAVQLVNEGPVYRRYGSGRQRILVAPAARWLACLP
jgi:predicted AAA+ superfamily ATPase